MSSILGNNINGKRSGRSIDDAFDLTEEVNDVKRQVVKQVVVEEEHGAECDGTCLLIECVNGEPERTCLEPEVCVRCLHYEEVDDCNICGTCQQGNTSHASHKQQIGFSNMLENPHREQLLTYLRHFLIVDCKYCKSLVNLRPTLPGQLEYICKSCEKVNT